MIVSRFAAVLASALVYAVAAGAASAGDGWRIVESAGPVKVGGSAFTPVAITRNQVLPADSWVETAASGRVVLMRGVESIAVGPNSRVYLPDEEVNGNTQVLQTLGSALYQIGKQKAPHFQVDTPYLAAVVKGTTFTVNVGEQATSVDVTEGVVEVATSDGADVELVRAGFMGLVSRGQRGTVVVAPTEQGIAPLPKSKASTDKSASNGGVVIPEPIGEMNVDVKDASGGLASGVVESINTGAGVIKEAGGLKLDNATGVVAKVVDVLTVEPVTVAMGVDIGGAPALDVGIGGLGVGADLGVGNGVGNGNNGGGLDLGIDVGSSGGGVGVGIGVGNGGVGLGVGVGLGGGNGNGQGLGLGLGNGNGNGK